MIQESEKPQISTSYDPTRLESIVPLWNHSVKNKLNVKLEVFGEDWINEFASRIIKHL